MAKVWEYLSRKFILSLLAMVGTFGLAWYGRDVFGWTGAITAILAFYNGSNIYQDYLSSRREVKKEEQE